MPYLKKYIPGNPTITMEFMDVASGRKAANYFYTGKPDGLKDRLRRREPTPLTGEESREGGMGAAARRRKDGAL